MNKLTQLRTPVEQPPAKKYVFDSNKGRGNRAQLQADKERRRAKAQKKAQRLKQIEEDKETDKRKWKEFATKAVAKSMKVKSISDLRKITLNLIAFVLGCQTRVHICIARHHWWPSWRGNLRRVRKANDETDYSADQLPRSLNVKNQSFNILERAVSYLSNDNSFAYL